MEGKSEGEASDGQKQLCEKVFHGSEGYSAVLDMFMDGTGLYRDAFNRVPIENNREGNEQRSVDKDGNAYMLELKSILTCDLSGRYIVHEDGFTRQSLAEDKKGGLIKGRNLADRALTGIANYKHTLKYYNDFCGPDRQLPSGKSVEDALFFCRRKMYVRLRTEYLISQEKRKQKQASKKGDVYEPKDVSVSEDDMPEGYLYNGYFAFVLFGPKGLSNKTLSCLMEKEGNVSKKGRAQIRKEATEVKNKERSSGVGRGVSTKDSFAFAALEQNQMRDEARNVRELLLIANQDEANALKQLEMMENMLNRAIDRDDDDRIQVLTEKQDKIFQELENIGSHKRKLQQLSDRLLLSDQKRAVSAVMVSRQEEDASTITASTPAAKSREPSSTTTTTTPE